MKYKEMATEPSNLSWYEQLIRWIASTTPLFIGFAAVWRGIDKAFKYFSESRDERIRQIVKDEVETVNEKLDKLSEDIFELKRHR